MDKIILSNLAFYGYHGVKPEENAIGQKFFVDVAISADLSRAGKTDDLALTVNYGEVYRLIKDIVTNSRFRLIEALAERIAGDILASCPAAGAVTVTVKKPEAPIPGIFGYAAVEITRARDE